MNNNRNVEETKSKDLSRVRPQRTFFNYPLALILIFSCVALILAVAFIISAVTEASGVIIVTVVSILFVISSSVIFFALLFSSKSLSRREVLIHRFDRMLDNMVFPYIITNKDGIIVKCNHTAEGIFAKKAVGALPSVSAVLPFLSPDIILKSTMDRVEVNWNYGDVTSPLVKYFIVESTETVISDGKKEHDALKGSYFLTTIVDVTNEKNLYAEIEGKLIDETAVVGRAEIDDLKFFASSSGKSEKEVADKVRELLTDWVLHQNGIIYEPETRKFIIIMPLAGLNRCIAEKFPILDIVRETISTKDDELTISIGFSATGDTLGERMKNADAAFEQRKSGNKVVVSYDSELLIFGRDRRRIVTRGGTEYRRLANVLKKYISASGNVLIMGHSRPDFDSLGASIGISKLAEEYGKEWNIVINDMADVNFARFTEDIVDLPSYRDKFIDERRAMNKLRHDTLLIITDVNNKENFESSDLYQSVHTISGGQIMIFDHHEKNDRTAECSYEYIDTSASSASEIITGIIELSLHRTKLTSEEATALLSGIMLDTKNFTQYTSMKTYAAAEFLSRSFANAEKAKRFFEADPETFMAEFKIGSNIRLFADSRIALCYGEGLSDEGKTKIAIGRLADSLLNMKDVLCSIVVAEYDGRINASARSDNNIVNCASLLAGIGGGNFNNAGARSTELTVDGFIDIIKQNIDDYFKENLDDSSNTVQKEG